MRRSIAILVCAAMCLLGAPRPAGAWFWKWLDDLSGPQFAGVSFDVRVWCGSQGSAERKAMLTTLRQRLFAMHLMYEQAEYRASFPEKRYWLAAMTAAKRALDLADQALGIHSDRTQIDALVVEALVWRARALEQARWAEHVARTGDDDPTRRPPPIDSQQPPEPAMMQVKTAAVSGVGGSASVCSFRPLDINKAFVSINVGYGWDTKNENRDDHNRILTVGGSVHWVPAPAIALGAGVGSGLFWSRPNKAFPKLYVQPLILDVKPFSIGHDPRFRSFWWHTFYVRYSVITFPGGFEANSFGGDSPEFPTEYVQTIGLHFDAEPLFRKWRKKWW